jgi:hypothetical protein
LGSVRDRRSSADAAAGKVAVVSTNKAPRATERDQNMTILLSLG